MNNRYITIKNNIINLDDVSRIELRKKFIDFYFGNSKVTINMKNSKNSEKRYIRLAEILKSSTFDISSKPKKPKKKVGKTKGKKVAEKEAETNPVESD